MQPSEADAFLNESLRKRKLDDLDGGAEFPPEGEAETPTTVEKKKCPCPICGCLLFEEDVNGHLDVCLNRSTVLEMVRETDRKVVLQPAVKPVPGKSVQVKGRASRKRR